MKLSTAAIATALLGSYAHAGQSLNATNPLRGGDNQAPRYNETASELRHDQPRANLSFVATSNASLNEFDNRTPALFISNITLNTTHSQPSSVDKDAAYYAKTAALMIAAMLPVVCCICALNALDRR